MAVAQDGGQGEDCKHYEGDQDEREFQVREQRLHVAQTASTF